MPVVERRGDSANFNPDTIQNPVYIIGVCVVGIIALSVGIWLAKRYLVRRRAEKGVWFLSVKGLVPENGDLVNEKPQISLPIMTGSFSRRDLDSTIPLPEKTLSRPRAPATRDEIIEYHRQSGSFPQSFSPKPFSFALSANSPDSRRSSKMRLSVSSFKSSGGSSLNRISVASLASSYRSADGQTTGAVRKVRQLFEPVLPDELLLTKVGEHLTIVQSFDDGWCVVGRESGTTVHIAKSLFRPTTPQPDNNVELGMVPAWCFVKPLKGVRVERPVRSTSLGVTVNLEEPSSRNELISWSNF